MSRPTSRASGRSSALGLHSNNNQKRQHLGGLSEKQYKEIESNISSARRPTSSSSSAAGVPSSQHTRRPSHSQGTSRSAESKASSRNSYDREELEEESEEETVSYSRQGKAVFGGPGSSRPPIAPAAAQPASYIASTAFAAAPLNSRVPPASPRRDLPPRASTSKVSQEQQPFSQESIELDGASAQIQEALLVEDLLSVLMGIEGQLITFDESYNPDDEADRFRGARFAVDHRVERSLRRLAERIIPLATYYTAVDAFVARCSHLEYGLINHALCAALRDLLQSYLATVAHLEHLFLTSPTFTLQRFWLYVQDALRTLSFLSELTTELLESPSDPDASKTTDGGGGDDDSSSFDLDSDGPGADGLKAVLGQMKQQQPTWASGGLVKGGEVLAVLEERIQRTSGDPAALRLYSSLLLSASQPYVRMLLTWISTGHLQDPHDEFMIRETKSITRGSMDQDYNDEYWERRYTLKDAAPSGLAGPDKASGKSAAPASAAADHSAGAAATSGRVAARERGLGGGAIVPGFLESWKARILLAGKYLNVIRECGLAIEVPDEVITGIQDGQIVMHNDQFYARIKAAYTYANKTLLRLLLEDRSLLLRLKSIKQNFFIDHGDSYTEFLDLAHQELAKKSKHVSQAKLQGYLDVAIRNSSSSSSTDPFKEDVKIKLESTNLTDWLTKVVSVEGALGPGEGPENFEMDFVTKREDAREERSSLIGIDALSLDYVVTFPLSLVISKNAILRYQLIFRHLLSLKQIELGLAHLWLEQTKSPLWRDKTPYPELERFKFRCTALRARMLAVVKEVYGFTVSEVLEPNWSALQQKMLEAETVDALLREHIDFLDTCLKECMLTMSRLLKHRNKLLHTIKLFRGHYATWVNFIKSALAEVEEAGGDWSAVNFEPASNMLSHFERNFTHYSQLHAESVQYQASSESVALLPLVYRLIALN